MPSLSCLNSHLFDFNTYRDDNRRQKIEDSIWKEFGKTGAVCVIDMCGFTRASQEKGIIYYLSMVRRMQIIVEPIIKEHNGSVVKFEADNCFARFNTVEEALKAVKYIFVAIDATNRTTHDDLDIDLSIGIDYGKYLLLEDTDYWGEPVNRASKLGEDIADKNNILLTDTAWEQIKNTDNYHTKIKQHEISGIMIDSYEIIKFKN
ncbi:MAG: adenylate/guanylate cyclase domain-containing protein [endosymbiont of Galathealinum brachiosum]|uniref:Adenylate/guanylate cyclase domain-containing protein n=1 Tax=endosymbiont of Galathealinum brachiosum TaxID=2200906 RepID=A0A370DJR9_9GAMM|nr:MAG: adenylate/guanylate cyclase domain-containing protein [endosymbiont of Galathealinum brachiosum]